MIAPVKNNIVKFHLDPNSVVKIDGNIKETIAIGKIINFLFLNNIKDRINVVGNINIPKFWGACS